MRRAILITVLAVLAFATILIARMPAGWIIPSPPANISCSAADGTIWSGTCTGLSVQGQRVGDIAWELRPARLFRGRLAAHVAVTRPEAAAQADLESTFSGKTITARNVKADVPLERTLIPQLPADLRGNTHTELALARLENGSLSELQGRIEARDLREVGNDPSPLGSYSLTFPGGSQPLTGELHDLGGPLSFQGTLTLTPAGFQVQGMVAARPDAPADLARQLQYLGSPDPQGRRPFSFENSF